MAKTGLIKVALKVILKTTKTYDDYRILKMGRTNRETSKKPICLHVQVLNKDLRRSVSAESMKWD